MFHNTKCCCSSSDIIQLSLAKSDLNVNQYLILTVIIRLMQFLISKVKQSTFPQYLFPGQLYLHKTLIFISTLRILYILLLFSLFKSILREQERKC